MSYGQCIGHALGVAWPVRQDLDGSMHGQAKLFCIHTGALARQDGLVILRSHCSAGSTGKGIGVSRTGNWPLSRVALEGQLYLDYAESSDPGEKLSVWLTGTLVSRKVVLPDPSRRDAQ